MQQLTGWLILHKCKYRKALINGRRYMAEGGWISIQDISQRKRIPARMTQNLWLSKKKEHSIRLLENEVM